ncbi:hypothetical protein BJ878DRAFT_147093 [Calycina marina]|uniref:RRM domain-containing protein n=1 Tax=Calycina marina TaxID=1763456 RepID=A0A9P7Z0K0_9HELO|nr:hypothetical protein BJ878DRAFT_147093 [Calycina marina]
MVSSMAIAPPQRFPPQPNAQFSHHSGPATPQEAYGSIASRIQVAVATQYGIPAAFFNVPKQSPCKFSTLNCTKEKRPPLHPAPPMIVRADLPLEIHRKAAELRVQLPQVARSAEKPADWPDLYKYYDAQDLQVEGPVFLYYVLNVLHNENKMLDYEEELARCQSVRDELLRNWATQWVRSNWDNIKSLALDADLTTMVSLQERQETSDCTQADWSIIRQAMSHQYNAYKARQQGTHAQNYANEQEHVQPRPVQPMVQRSSQQLSSQNGVVQHNDQVSNAAMYYDKPSGRILDDHRFQNNNGQSYAYSQDVSQGQEWQYGRDRGFSNQSNGNSRNNRQNQRNNGGGNNNNGFTDRHMEHRNHKGNERQYNNSHNNRSGHFDRRAISANNSWSSPQHNMSANPKDMLRRFHTDLRLGQNQAPTPTPVYVLNNAGQAGGRTGYDQRNFTEPVRQNYSNDARNSHNQCSMDIPAEDPRCAYFPGDPNVEVHAKGINYFYEPTSRGDAKIADNKSRTVYVAGAAMQAFLSHELKYVMAEFGLVAYISCLDNGFRRSQIITAFVVFMHQCSAEQLLEHCKTNKVKLSSGQELKIDVPTFKKNNYNGAGGNNSYYSQDNRQYPRKRDFGNRGRAVPLVTILRRAVSTMHVRPQCHSGNITPRMVLVRLVLCPKAFNNN